MYFNEFAATLPDGSHGPQAIVRLHLTTAAPVYQRRVKRQALWLRATANMIEAIFLDRDGTLNAERQDYVKAWREFKWLPGAVEGMRRLAAVPAPIVVVTNQSAIGRGLVSCGTVDQIHWRMQYVVNAFGGRIDEIYVCPHRPEDHCTCRKPKPGLLLKAAAEFRIDLTKCVLIGDTITDYEAASAVGCPCVLVQTGRQGAQLPDMVTSGGRVAIVADLSSAVDLILAGVGQTAAFMD